MMRTPKRFGKEARSDNWAKGMVALLLKKANGELLTDQQKETIDDFMNNKDFNGKSGSEWLLEIMKYELSPMLLDGIKKLDQTVTEIKAQKIRNKLKK